MKLEAGKKYTDRRGRVYGPLIEDSNSFYEDEYGISWWPHGRVSTTQESFADLVAEYVEPVSSASVESLANMVADVIIDAMAEPDPETFPQYWTSNDDVVAYGVCLSPESHKWVYKNGIESKVFEIPMYGLGERKQITEAEALALVKKPEPVASPEDWVILDPAIYADHVARVGIDQWSCGVKWHTQEEFHAIESLREFNEEGADPDSQYRCLRKDLPPVPETSVLQKGCEAAVGCVKCETCGDLCKKTSVTDPEWPRYYIGRKWADSTAFVRRDDENSFIAVRKNGTTFGRNMWTPRDINEVDLKEVTSDEAMSRLDQVSCKTCGDLCEKTSKPEVWPKWFLVYGNVVKFPETGDSSNYGADGRVVVGFPASHYSGRYPKSWVQITEDEATETLTKWGHIKKPAPKTRTVTIREWACWEDERESEVTLVWSSRDPTIDDDGFIGWDNAVLTGDVRTIELQVSQ